MSRTGPGSAARTPRKVWSGRLSGPTSQRLEEYSSSFESDRRLFAEDILGSRAHARMLRKIGLLNGSELRTLDRALRDIRGEFEEGVFVSHPGDEDIHTAIERRLFELAGDVAGKLHTGRSRNDQIATDLRLYAKRVCRELMLAASGLQAALVKRAKPHLETVIPGYTHGQRAQVVSLAHHLLAYVEMLQRDIERLADAHDRCDVLTLGSGALAGSALPLDRRDVAKGLDFSRLSANSLDAVGDRDFVVELTAACALIVVHLSRLAEELILWCTAEFGFASLPDHLSTGSSLMPQKKNPDPLELARGRSARVIGDLTALLTLLKGLPLAYNRDLQEDKHHFFDAVDTTLSTLAMVTEVVAAVEFDAAAMRSAASDPGLMATDVADYLVLRGVPFREAHHIVGSAVQRAEKHKQTIADLSAADWRNLSDQFDDDVIGLFDLDRCLRRREIHGGPGPKAVARQLLRAATMIERTRGLVKVLSRHPAAAREIGAGAQSRR